MILKHERSSSFLVSFLSGTYGGVLTIVVGTAIFFLTPLWPRRANVVLSLDGEDPPTTVDLQDYSLPNGIGVEHPSKGSDIRWSRTDLPDGEHTLVITRGTSAFVDAFM